jgi:ribosome-binding protein aMBF1 (putative translation factor)
MAKKIPCERCLGTGVEPDNKDIGSFFRSRRERANLSLRALAEKLGISPSFLSQLERGDRRWTRDVVRKCDEAIGHP